LRELLQDLDRGGPHRGRLASLGLWELLLHLDSAAQPGARTARVTTISARSRFAGQVEAIIRRRVGEKLTLASIAAEACTSVSQLAHAYKAACGETVKQAVLRCRLESAKALLREGRQEIKEVAHATGFSSAAAFAAVFRRLEGRPPSAYQRQLKPQR
jgi:AraC-like DNA-binding protein